jgi:hypothetical protein
MSEGGGEYTLEETLTQGKGTFNGWNPRSPKVTVTMEREGGEERKKGGGRKGSTEPWIVSNCDPRNR